MPFHYPKYVPVYDFTLPQGVKLALDKRVADLETSLKAATDENTSLKRKIVELESTIRAITDENEQV